MDERIFVGVLRMVLDVPGARSLKDRRQVVVSLRDRVRARFDVTFHEVDTADRPTRQIVVVTTAGNDGGPIRATLDQIVHFVGRSGGALLRDVDVDVFRWHPLDKWTGRPFDVDGDEGSGGEDADG